MTVAKRLCRGPGREPAVAGSATEPIDQLALHRANLTRTLRRIRATGPRSQAAIAAATGLHKATVSSLVDELLARRLVRDRGGAVRGRRPHGAWHRAEHRRRRRGHRGHAAEPSWSSTT
ncbi:helix-turn-helix domain-containing protein [Dactylosporangium sp. NPDC005572]|uniref:MarR family transcriptional regulator n=1 Tax=Dactylosporangium sp. NPDC005572 TaxID=3156889 RepID=UPI0033B514B0